MGKAVAKTATLASGLALSYAEQGEPRGVPLILLHGYSDSWRSYATLLDHLPERLWVVAPSHRGHGDSAKPEGSYRIADFAADLMDFMDRLGAARAVLMGHSMGSLVAQRAAIDHPERFAGLILIGAFATLKGNPGGEELWRDAVSGLADPVDPVFAREFQQATLARPVPAEFFEQVVAESLKAPAHVWRAALAAMLGDDFSGEAGRIAAPTLILWGDRDGFSGRAEQESLARTIPQAELIRHSGAGHAPHWEDPARAAREIVAFIDRLA